MVVSRESLPDDLRHPADRPLFGFLVPFLAVTVAIAAWLVLWILPEFSHGMEDLLGPPPEPSFVERFGTYWQWVVAGATLWLITALLLRSSRIRLSVTVWASSLVLLGWASWAEFGIRWLGVIAILAGVILSRWIWVLASPNGPGDR